KGARVNSFLEFSLRASLPINPVIHSASSAAPSIRSSPSSLESLLFSSLSLPLLPGNLYRSRCSYEIFLRDTVLYTLQHLVDRRYMVCIRLVFSEAHKSPAALFIAYTLDNRIVKR